MYIYWLGSKDDWKDELARSYVGTYTLTKYKNLQGSELEINDDHTYLITFEQREIEHGTWAYFDDGDLFYLEFSNGGVLGSGEYEYARRGPR